MKAISYMSHLLLFFFNSSFHAANPMRSTWNPEAEFAYRSGMINPLKAVHPGLVYDIEIVDYVKLLGAEGYPMNLLQPFIEDESFDCSKSGNIIAASDLNYPSSAISITHREAFSHS